MNQYNFIDYTDGRILQDVPSDTLLITIIYNEQVIKRKIILPFEDKNKIITDLEAKYPTDTFTYLTRKPIT
jgi:hypothetical protein